MRERFWRKQFWRLDLVIHFKRQKPYLWKTRTPEKYQYQWEFCTGHVELRFMSRWSHAQRKAPRFNI